MHLKSWLEETQISLQSVSQNPRLDALILLVHEFGKDKSWILAHPEHELEPGIIASLQIQINKAMQGKPIPYLIGHWDFYALDFLITPDVLIPRPETEMMVDLALNWMREEEGSKKILDMGTGSGCIAVALALHSPHSSIVGIDSSEKALGVARKNAEKFHVESRIQFLKSNLFSMVHGSFDVICANLPYIPTSEMNSLPVAKFEPNVALDGGEDGLAIISTFLKEAGSFIKQPGLILSEYGIGQDDKIQKMSEIHFPNAIRKTFKDLQGISRLLAIQV